MSLTIKQQLISDTKYKYGRGNGKKYITIHETANTGKGADAQAHANLQSRVNPRAASWHYQVDDKQAIQSFSHDFQLWHAGDSKGTGNLQSIGIEICVNSDGNFAKAIDNAAALVRKIMKDEGIPLSNVVQHSKWSGKNCPANLRSGSKGIAWADFVSKLSESHVEAPKPPSNTKPKPTTKTVAQMADEVIAGKHGNGHDNRRKSLGIDAATYEKVKAEVNRRSGVTSKPKPTKSIAQMVDEVIAGKHGTGHANRQKSLGVDSDTYNKVKDEVNRKLSGQVSKPKPKPKGNQTTGSIVVYLQSIGEPSSFVARKKLAAKHGIKNYTGTAAQNVRLLDMIRRK